MWKCANVQVCKCTRMQGCKCAMIHMCYNATIYLSMQGDNTPIACLDPLCSTKARLIVCLGYGSSFPEGRQRDDCHGIYNLLWSKCTIITVRCRKIAKTFQPKYLLLYCIIRKNKADRHKLRFKTLAYCETCLLWHLPTVTLAFCDTCPLSHWPTLTLAYSHFCLPLRKKKQSLSDRRTDLLTKMVNYRDANVVYNWLNTLICASLPLNSLKMQKK